MSLPPFPVDDGTLDLLSKAINPGPEAERSSVEDLLTLYSQLGGSDTGAVAEVIDERDPSYHVHDVLAALIAEYGGYVILRSPHDREGEDRRGRHGGQG